jgi:hypothetical protein
MEHNRHYKLMKSEMGYSRQFCDVRVMCAYPPKTP